MVQSYTTEITAKITFLWYALQCLSVTRPRKNGILSLGKYYYIMAVLDETLDNLI